MIVCRSKSEIEKLRRSGRLVRQLLDETRQQVRAGITTRDLEGFVQRRLREEGAKPAFKGYRGYPCCLCASVNEEIIHSIPSDRRLKDGDIVSLDLGVIVDGYYGDSALTAAVGEIPEPVQRLMRVTQECLELGIRQARGGNRVGDISWAVQQHAEENGYSVVREFVGHGVGRALHEEPQVPNYGQPGRGPVLKPGMVIAIEPMINAGGPDVRVLKDKWTAVTADGQCSAHFEHMVAITPDGADILTELDDLVTAPGANLVSAQQEGRL